MRYLLLLTPHACGPMSASVTGLYSGPTALEARDASVNRPAYILIQGGRCRTAGAVDAKANKQSGTEREQECWGAAVNGAIRTGLGSGSEGGRSRHSLNRAPPCKA